MSQKIYTKTGDKGYTTLIGGTRVPKNNLRIETYGTIDELNSFIGLLGDQEIDTRSKSTLKEIQDRLFTIGSSLACDPGKEPKMKLPDLKETDVEFLEKEIDSMNEMLPEMKSFILPGGSTPVSFAHLARCVCRRAERYGVNMQQQELFIDPLIIKYLNRLSDHLFVLARYIGHVSGVKEIQWGPRISTHPH
ncbi:MAG: cob(I)yrinic acid a,c-diamide adenosyltransferase [Flavitalea sp.]